MNNSVHFNPFRTNLTYWAKSLLVDAGIVVISSLAVIMNVEGFKGLLTFLVIALLIDSLLQSTLQDRSNWRPEGFRLYRTTTEALFISFLLWNSLYLLAAIMLIRVVVNNFPKVKAALFSLKPKKHSNIESSSDVSLAENVSIEELSFIQDLTPQLSKNSKVVDMEFFTLDLVESLVKNNSFDSVVIKNLYKGDLDSFNSFIKEYPNTRFYISTSNIKSFTPIQVKGNTTL